MLGVNAYDQSYIDDCRARMEAQLAAYEKLELGDEIRLDLARFTQRCHAYFAEIELKFGK